MPPRQRALGDPSAAKTVARVIRFWLVAIVGCGLLALVLEVMLQLLPVGGASRTDYYVDPLILTMPPGHRRLDSAGWDLRHPQPLQANNHGFVAPLDFVRDPQSIALIGDSFVESAALPPADRLGAQLQRRVGQGRTVYALGAPGSALLDYAERMRYASNNFGTRDFVVLIARGDLRQSVCGPAANSHGPCIDPKTLQPTIERRANDRSAIKDVLRRSALAQYLFSQLRASPQRLIPTLAALPATLLPRGLVASEDAAQAPTPSRAASVSRPEIIDAVVDAFFDRIAPLPIRRLVFVIDRQSGSETPDGIDAESDRLVRAARARGQGLIVDMAGPYAQHRASSQLSLYVAPYDKHFNRLGAEVVSDAMAQALQTGAAP